MAATPRQAAPPQFRIGSPVVGREGTVGSLQRVVIDPESEQITDLIIRLDAPGPERQVVLSTSHVGKADDQQIDINLSREEAQRLPDFEEVRFRQPSEAWPGLPDYTPDVVLFWAPRTAVEAFRRPIIVTEPNVEGVRHIPEGSVTVSADLEVFCGAEMVGRVKRVLLDPDADHATHLVVRHGVYPAEEKAVPVSHVQRVTDTTVELDCRAADLESFPAYRGD